MANQDIEFEDTKNNSRVYVNESEVSRMTRWVIRVSGGMIHTERQAELLMLACVMVAFVISAFLVFGFLDSSPPARQGGTEFIFPPFFPNGSQ